MIAAAERGSLSHRMTLNQKLGRSTSQERESRQKTSRFSASLSFVRHRRAKNEAASCGSTSHVVAIIRAGIVVIIGGVIDVVPVIVVVDEIGLAHAGILRVIVIVDDRLAARAGV